MSQRTSAPLMKRTSFKVLVVIETAVIGFIALGLFGMLIERYETARDTIAERTVIARASEVYIAILSATPPTATATNTSTATRTSTPTKTSTPTTTFTPKPSTTPTLTSAPTLPRDTATPRNTATPRDTSTPRNTTAPVDTALPPTPRPTDSPSVAWKNITSCGTIDSSGSYRLLNDVSANGECISIKASYVILDCFRNAVRGTNFAGHGIAIRKFGLFNSQTPGYVEVRNCRVSGFRDGIYAEAGDHLVIRDNETSHNYDDVDPATKFGKFLGMTDGSGIRLNNVTSSQVLNNTTTNQAIGIDIRYSNGISVRSNTASQNSAWGINFLRTQNSEAVGNTTADNVRKCTWGAGTIGWGCDAGGIVIQDGSNGITVARNQVIGRNGNGVFIKAHALPCGSNNAILGNTITGVYYNAVELGFCTGNRINDNQIRDGLDGIWLGYAHDTEIRGNTISGMRNHGIISGNSYGNTVTGNQIISSNEGLYFFGEEYDRSAFSWLPPGDYKSHDNCLCGNTLQSNAIAVHLQDSTRNQVTNNTYVGNARTFLVQGNSDGNNLQGYDWRSPAEKLFVAFRDFGR
ncbi:MAG: right-handed parallel beta-helix repeat-containing protein [Chloroflexi bacterium]|nr:right-handed parallel beta-helix repeat-containing protein [Chloroflexota bacterium]